MSELKPIKFKQANRNLLPKDRNAKGLISEDDCLSLWVFIDERQCISCWKLSFIQRLKVLLYGRIWMSVLSGTTQPPVWLDCNKTVFKKRE